MKVAIIIWTIRLFKVIMTIPWVVVSALWGMGKGAIVGFKALWKIGEYDR
jgi:uncharacterized membrane protein